MSDIARRKVLVSLAATLAGVMLPSVGLAAQPVLDSQELDGLLNTLVPDIAAAARLGRAYLAAHPAELDPQRLVGGLLRDLRLPAVEDALDSTPGAALVAKARRVVADDYLVGRVVIVDGWLLSITEARLYALARMLPTSGTWPCP